MTNLMNSSRLPASRIVTCLSTVARDNAGGEAHRKSEERETGEMGESQRKRVTEITREWAGGRELELERFIERQMLREWSIGG